MLVGAFLLSVPVALGPQRLQPEGRLHVVQTLQAFSLALAFVGAMRSFAFIPINRTLHPAPLHTSRHASGDRHRIGEQDRTSDMPSPVQPCRTHRTGHMPSHCPPGRTRPSEQPPEHAGQQVPGDQPADHDHRQPDEAHHMYQRAKSAGDVRGPVYEGGYTGPTPSRVKYWRNPLSTGMPMAGTEPLTPACSSSPMKLSESALC